MYEAGVWRWEISENLHRADLTTLQRNEQIAEWIRLTEEKQATESGEVLPQVGAKPQGGRPKGGVRAATRELGISNGEADRALKIARIASAAKEAAKAAGLENHQGAQLEVSPDGQVADRTHSDWNAYQRQLINDGALVPCADLALIVYSAVFTDDQ